MDIIKKILCFTLLGDLFYFDKKVKSNEEVSGLNKIYRFNGQLRFIVLCVSAIFLCLIFIPIVNIFAIMLFIILALIFYLFTLVYILVRNVIILVSHQKINLENYSEYEKAYLKLNRLNSILFFVVVLTWFLSVILSNFIPKLGFLVSLIVFVFLIVKIVVYVISRFKLYKIVKSEEF